MTAALDAVDAVFGEHFARGAAPSLAWGTFDRTGLVHFGSAGASPGGVRPSPDTAYRIASCTKSFTAAAVLALRDRGALALDDPITRYVPALSSVRLPQWDSAVPTVRMLLTMSGGLPTDDPWADRQEALGSAEFDDMLRRGVTFESTPGTRFAYSNLGYALLGRVVEQASGSAYRDLITELFLEPLGLTGTGFDASVAATGGVSPGTRWLDSGWQVLPFSGPGQFSPIGGLFSTVSDLSRWAAWLADAFDESVSDESTADARIGTLSRASRREMQQQYRFVPTLPQHPTGYGFGLFVEQYPNGPVVSHSGGYPGFSAHMRWSAAGGHGVVAFGNATHSRLSAATTRAFDLLEAAAPHAPARVLPATRSAAGILTGLIHTWDDEAAHALFAGNVQLDESIERRRAVIAAAVSAVGGLAAPLTPTDAPPTDATATAIGPHERSASPAHLVWHIPGAAGRLRVEIRMTPEYPPRVQTFTVSADLVHPR